MSTAVLDMNVEVTESTKAGVGRSQQVNSAMIRGKYCTFNSTTSTVCDGYSYKTTNKVI